MTTFDFFSFVASVFSGAVASITGFGIGSILTPLLAAQAGTKIAVAAVAIPHFIATFIRLWIIRAQVNKRVLLGFGIASAAGGLAGAALQSVFRGAGLTLIFGALLMVSGFTGMTGIAQKMRLHGAMAWVAGSLSGAFGGLVGNQGGIRSAALMTFNLSKEELVATGTAVGVMVDLARLPVYIGSECRELMSARNWILVATVGVVAGTVLGIKGLRGISENTFRRLLGGLILLLGVYMIIQGIGSL
jgi:uncharacterized protein